MMLIKTLIEEICFHFSLFGSSFFIFKFFTSFENHLTNLFLSTLCVLSFLKICLPHRFLASYCLLVIIFFSCCFLDLNGNYLKFLATLFLIFHYLYYYINLLHLNQKDYRFSVQNYDLKFKSKDYFNNYYYY